MTKYQKIHSVSKYFLKKDNQYIFTSKSLRVRIPKFYIESGLCTLGNKIHTLGVFQLIIDETYEASLFITNMIDITPFDIDTSSDEEYVIATFRKDDVFIPNVNIIKSPSLLYNIFNSFIILGKIPSYITYDEIHMLFSKLSQANGVKISVGNEVFSLIYSHLYRDADNPTIMYRHTDKKKPPVVIGLQNIVYAPKSTTAKLLGNYLDDGITGVLITDKPKSDPIEKIITT